MTPYEHAGLLVSTYLNLDIDLFYLDSRGDCCITTGDMPYYSAVKCAIVAVNQILKARKINSKLILDKKYWEEVLQELEKRQKL